MGFGEGECAIGATAGSEQDGSKAGQRPSKLEWATERPAGRHGRLPGFNIGLAVRTRNERRREPQIGFDRRCQARGDLLDTGHVPLHLLRELAGTCDRDCLPVSIVCAARGIGLVGLRVQADHHQPPRVGIEIGLDETLERFGNQPSGRGRLADDQGKLGPANTDEVGIGPHHSLTERVVGEQVAPRTAQLATTDRELDSVREQPTHGVARRFGGDRLVEHAPGLVPAAGVVQCPAHLGAELAAEARIRAHRPQPIARRSGNLKRLFMACGLVESPAQANGGKEDGLRIPELEREDVGIAQHRGAALKIRATGEVEAQRGERARLREPRAHRPRDGEGCFGECHRLAEPAAHHEGVR
ncbi:MAG: hypothetical protein ACR2GO_01765 [Candidatus Limnocylindria bacterium]